jgi:hypothetical protein
MLYLTPDEMFARHRRLFAECRRLAGYMRWKLSNWRAMKERDEGLSARGDSEGARGPSRAKLRMSHPKRKPAPVPGRANAFRHESRITSSQHR